MKLKKLSNRKKVSSTSSEFDNLDNFNDDQIYMNGKFKIVSKVNKIKNC